MAGSWLRYALSILVVLLLFDVIPTFRTETIERNQPPVLQRLERLNKFKAASSTYEGHHRSRKDVDGVPSVIAGERTVMIACPARWTRKSISPG